MCGQDNGMLACVSPRLRGILYSLQPVVSPDVEKEHWDAPGPDQSEQLTKTCADVRFAG